jgi:hypothetical protein
MVRTVSLLDEKYVLASLDAVEYEHVGVTFFANDGADGADGTAVD